VLLLTLVVVVCSAPGVVTNDLVALPVTYALPAKSTAIALGF